jgi:hypothetical protein
MLSHSIHSAVPLNFRLSVQVLECAYDYANVAGLSVRNQAARRALGAGRASLTIFEKEKRVRCFVNQGEELERNTPVRSSFTSMTWPSSGGPHWGSVLCPAQIFPPKVPAPLPLD